MDGRPLDLLPKAHLHLHFTGSLRAATLLELADETGTRLPDALADALATGRRSGSRRPTSAGGSVSSGCTTRREVWSGPRPPCGGS